MSDLSFKTCACFRLLTVVILCALAPLIADAKEITPEDFSRFCERWVSERMAATHTPGMTIVAAQGEKLILSKQWGYSYLDDAGDGVTRMGPYTGLRVGSISKVFVGIAALKLEGLRLLDMDVDARQHLPQRYSRTMRQPFTMRQLLTHSAGFGEKLAEMGTTEVTDLYELEAYFDKHLQAPLAPVGDRAVYTNQGISMAALVVERITGQSFAEYAQNTIFNPLGMVNTTYIPNQEAQNKLATGYAFVFNKHRPVPLRHWLCYPASSLVTHASDVEKFLLALLDESERKLLGPDARKALQSQQQSAAPGMPGITHVFWEHEAHGQRVLWHSGHMPGHRSGLFWLPEHDLALFLNYNLESYYVQEFLDDFLSEFFSGQSLKPDAQPLNAAAIQLGTYRKNWYPRTTFGKTAVLAGFEGEEVQVSASGNQLIVGSKAYLHLGSNRFVEAGGGQAPLQYLPERGRGRPAYITYGGMRNYEFTPLWHTVAFSRLVFALVAAGIILTLPSGFALQKRYSGKDARAYLYRPRKRAAWCGLLGSLVLAVFAAVVAGSIIRGAYGVIQDMPTYFRITLWLPVVAAACYVLMIAFTLQSMMRNPMPLTEKLHFAVLTLSALLFAYYAHYWCLLGPRL